MRKDRELEIIHELAESVLPFAGAISEACDICAELDCLLCFSDATNQYNFRRPQMSEENVTDIKQGRYGAFSVKPPGSVANLFFFSFLSYRHPLQEQTVDTFVPNDILIVGGAGIGSYPAVHVGEGDGDNSNLMSEGVSSILGNSVVICTGANACGKVNEALSICVLSSCDSNVPMCARCRVSISNRCVLTARSFFWTPIFSRFLGYPKAALIQLMAQVGSLFSYHISYVRLKHGTPLDWLVRVHVEVLRDFLPI